MTFRNPLEDREEFKLQLSISISKVFRFHTEKRFVFKISRSASFILTSQLNCEVPLIGTNIISLKRKLKLFKTMIQHIPCIRLARGKFELTNQDSAGGEKI